MTEPDQKLPPATRRSRNLVRFARHLPSETMHESFAGDFAFRDAASRFSLLKSPQTLPGPDECFSLFARDARRLFDKLLGLQLTYPGLSPEQQEGIRGYNSMNYYRSHVVEYFFDNGVQPLPPLAGECSFWFAATDVLCIHYRLKNKSEADVPVELRWVSNGCPGQEFLAAPAPGGFSFQNTESVGDVRYLSRAELITDQEDAAFQVEGPNLRSLPIQRIVPAEDAWEGFFAVRFVFDDEPFADWPPDVFSVQSLHKSIAATEAAYDGLPSLSTEMQEHYDLTIKAAGTLRALRYRARGRQGQPTTTIHAGKTGCAATWFWDTAVTLPGLGILQERPAATGALRILTEGIADDGRPSVTYENGAYRHYGYQMPILAWGAGHFLASCPDDALLSEIYPALCRYVQHWLDNFMSPWGVVYHPPGSSCLDDALRWQNEFPLKPHRDRAWHEEPWGKMAAEEFACPDINAFLVLELRTLRQMALRLGRPEEAAAFAERADTLAKAINAHLLEPTTGMYQDRHITTGRFNQMIHMGSFMPIYAGIAAKDTAERACREYLLDPEHFLTNFPFPVVDQAHPTFRSGGFLFEPKGYPGSLVQQAYWCGRTWVHSDNWYLGCLWQNGFEQEADELAGAILRTLGRTEGICEVYDSLTGAGNGHPEFMWSSAAVLMMAHGFYHCDPVAKLV